MSPGKSTTPDETFTIRPQPRSTISGRTALVSRNTPTRLICRAAIQSSGSRRQVGSRGQTTAALLTRMSTGPSSETTRRQTRAATSGAPTSARISSARPPTAPTSPAASASWGEERATSATSAPSLASAAAAARPMPRPAPVTTATRPSSCPTTFTSEGFLSIQQPRRYLKTRQGVGSGGQSGACTR
jgi:hypothetical protein